ncbi:gamma-type small acid-soluble spore protein [Domibacillus sp. 8LH]|uniref:gamma-type small acid-soluble spore protein n=1 Tax=Domibacillus TaxID=1433999 RepID=UPI001F583D6C|nr:MULTISPECIES: gamma-type small acid-soluble spore protein [Domibacillus]MCI2254839.1 gamma-type small acid-soluble spore protein [Domibacillus sp. PGB-M46]MCM3789072.1 gamma-type small acid-soluble spore protein [Domibacillus indicus]
MPNKRNKTVAGTDVNVVKKQNAASAQGQGQQYGEEFASETNVQEVQQQNAKSAARKKNSTTNG